MRRPGDPLEVRSKQNDLKVRNIYKGMKVKKDAAFTVLRPREKSSLD
jgi:hypothetical protein